MPLKMRDSHQMRKRLKAGFRFIGSLNDVEIEQKIADEIKRAAKS